MKITLRRIRVILLQIMIAAVTLELAPFLLWPLFFGGSFSPGAIRRELDTSPARQENPAAVNDTSEWEWNSHILHPYLGFTSSPVNDYNRFGFLGDDPLKPVEPAEVRICITGGSVAKGLFVNAGDYLIERLRKNPAWKEKSLRLILLAQGGYKQPQQLLALNYFLSLGARFDAVINLDGFNEIVLPYSDNLPAGVDPSYPRNWNLYSLKGFDLNSQIIAAREAELKIRAVKSRQFFSRLPWRYSNIMLLTWKALDQRRQKKIFDLDESLRRSLAKSGSGYQSTGPFDPVSDTAVFFADLAALWGRSSLLMSNLCNSSGIGYFHFLQPNQYVKGSRTFTDEEKRIALESGPFSYRVAVEAGYSSLTEEGKKLVLAGVDFTDLTMMFVQEPRTVYQDKCCHFNELGYRLICDRIAERMILNAKQSNQ